MDFLKQMMTEHHTKTLEEWLEATTHLDSVEVTKVFNDVHGDGGPSIQEIENAYRW